MRIHYVEGSLEVVDERAYDVMRDLVDVGEDVEVSSENLIHALRLLVLEKYVGHNKIEIEFDGVVYGLNAYGNVEPDYAWLSGAPELFVGKILRLQLEMVKRNLR